MALLLVVRVFMLRQLVSIRWLSNYRVQTMKIEEFLSNEDKEIVDAREPENVQHN